MKCLSLHYDKHLARHLGGKVLLSKLLGYPVDYIVRIHDLNSMIAMVKLQLVLQQEGLNSADEIMNAVNATASGSDSLLAARGLKFDSAAGWLQFDCLYERSMCKINLYASNN